MTARGFDVVARLRQAQRAVEAAWHHGRRQRDLRTATDAASSLANLLGATFPEAADEARALADRLMAAADVSRTLGADRWAIVREAQALKREGVQPHRLARVLLDLGVCRPHPTPTAARKACLTALRAELRRFRAAGGA
jgi:hypothetical protein